MLIILAKGSSLMNSFFEIKMNAYITEFMSISKPGIHYYFKIRFTIYLSLDLMNESLECLRKLSLVIHHK